MVILSDKWLGTRLNDQRLVKVELLWKDFVQANTVSIPIPAAKVEQNCVTVFKAKGTSETTRPV